MNAEALFTQDAQTGLGVVGKKESSMNQLASRARRRTWLVSVAWCAACSVALLAQAEEPRRAVASPVQGWPQWRGPRRDGVSAEQGLLQEWPEAGPRLLWSIRGIGRGFGSPIVVGGSIYIAGDVEEASAVFALDLSGTQKWRTTNGKPWKKSHPGETPAT